MSSLGLPADAEPTDNFATIPDVPINPVNSITNPNQIRSGVTRGIQQLGSDKVYSDGGNNQIIVEDDTDSRVLMGNHPAFGEGFFVSKPGYEVKTDTDPAHYIFISNNNVFKIVKIVPISFTLAYTTNATPNGNQGGIASVAHGLTFEPSWFANVKMDASAASQNGNSPTQNYGNPGRLSGWVGSHVADYVTATVTVDSTNVYLTVLMDTQAFTNGTYTYTATAYLEQETFSGS